MSQKPKDPYIKFWKCQKLMKAVNAFIEQLFHRIDDLEARVKALEEKKD